MSWLRSFFNYLVRRRLLVWIPLLVVLALLPLLVPNQYYIHVAVLAAIYIVLVLGLNFAVGYAGMLNLGYAAFFGIGAYSYAILSTRLGVSFWLGIPASGMLAAVFGLLVSGPTLRVRGDYLAVVTLAFGEVTRLVFRNWDALTLGPKGIPGIAPPRIGSYDFTSPAAFYYLALAFVLVAYFLARRWHSARIGRAWLALKDNEVAASTLGVNPHGRLTQAFVISSAFAGVAGALFASWQGFTAPRSFIVMESITMLAMAILSGGSAGGVVLATGVLILVPEFLRGFVQYRMLLFGVALVLIMLFRPKWLSRRKHRATTRRQTVPDLARDGPVSPDAPLSKPGALLEVAGLSKSFSGVQALKDLSLSLPAGEPTVVAIIGPNGAGKSTFFDCLSGVLRPTSGRILFGEERRDITRMPPHRRCLLGIGRNFQDTKLFDEMTAFENILVGLDGHNPESMFSAVLRFGRQRATQRRLRQRALDLLDFVELGDKCDHLARELSYGQQRRLEIARTLALDPQLLLLDEPTTGINETQLKIILDLIARIRRERGISVLIIEHDMKVAMGIADRVVVLDAGRKIAEGTPEQVQSDPAVLEAYLGKRAAGEAGPATRVSGKGDVILSLRDVHGGYGGRSILKGVSLDVHSGEIVTLLGPNGAGKTTMLMTISQLLRPFQGSIRFLGTELTGLSPSRVVRQGVVHVPQGRGIFPNLSVLENLSMGGFLEHDSKVFRERVEVVFEMFPVLRERKRQPGTHLSGGEQQMLAIGRALMSSPQLLMLDEPSLGLAPNFAARFFDTIRQLRDRGLAILLVEQKVRDALMVADTGYVLEGGTISLRGTGAELLASERIHKSYLGG